MMSTAGDVEKRRAITDILGHSPEMLLNTSSHEPTWVAYNVGEQIYR